MSEKFRLDRKIGFQNTFYTKCINVIIDSIGPLTILRSIFGHVSHLGCKANFQKVGKSIDILKVIMGAKIRNRYNQVPHLSQDT